MKKKWIVGISAFVVLLTVGAVWWFLGKRVKEAPTVPGAVKLQVLSYSPQGTEVPISTEGITVMFDRAVVPLTTLDQGRGQAVDLRVTPNLDGKFFWLGTHGFIFRPSEPFDPATTYHLSLPAGLTAIDGSRMEAPFEWEFSTVTPRIVGRTPDGLLLPRKASFFIRFNVAMKTREVEGFLKITDSNTGQPLKARRGLRWSEGGHLLRVDFGEALPWDAKIEVTLPTGIKGRKGDLGLGEPLLAVYSTPPPKVEVKGVLIDRYSEEGEFFLKGGGGKQEIGFQEGICYRFSQPIMARSFEKAFQLETVKKGQPYFYYRRHEDFDFKGEDRQVGYREGCVLFTDDYHATYSFRIDPKAIESLSGAVLETGGDSYTVETGPAEPALNSYLEKNILSLQGSLKIPYGGINLRGVKFRLYHLRPEEGSWLEWVRDDRLTARGTWDPKLNMTLADKPGMSEPLGGRLSLPLDLETMTIDQSRMPATAELDLPLSSEPDVMTRFFADLASLPKGRPEAGFYLIEAIASPREEGGSPPQAVYTAVQLTSVGIAIKREVDHFLIWTTELETGKPIAALPLRVTQTDSNGKEVRSVTATTDPQGVALLRAEDWSDHPICVEALQNWSYSCDEYHRISPYRTLLGAGPHYFAYLYTDRPIYRPGQHVFFSSFIREVKEGRYFLPASETLYDLSMTDAAGKVIYKQEKVKADPGGVLGGGFDLSDSEDIPRGDYQLTVKAGAQHFTKVFVVASYRKPSFKVDLKARKNEIVSREELRVAVTGSYFFGAPMKKAKTGWSIMTSTYLFSPEGYEGVSFIDPDLLLKREGEDGPSYASEYEYDTVSESGQSEDDSQYDDPRGGGATRSPAGFFKDPQGKKVVLPASRLDEEGRFDISYTPDLAKYPTSQTLTVEANVEDPSRQEVSGSEEVIVHKADFYLGIGTDKWVYGTNEKAGINVVSLDTAGKTVSGKSFSVDLYRREYKFIQRRNAQGGWEFLFEPEDTRLKTLTGKTGGDGRAALSFVIPQGGTFRLVVKGGDRKKNEIQAATTVEAWGEGYAPWRLDEPEKLELVPDRDSYQVGETAHILVKSLVPVTKALMTLERGRLLEYKVIDLGGNASHLEIPITEGMIPNLYLSVVAHVGRESSHPPLLFYGETEIRVEPERKRLQVEITPDRQGKGDELPVYRPGDEVRVRVTARDPSGRPQKAHLVVSVADESVLKLLDYRLPDLVKKFYYERLNSVQTSSSLLSLKAADAGTGAGKKRRVFKDTAHFETHLVTNEQGEAQFSFKLPDDLTTWVIEALGITESKGFPAFEEERKGAVPERPVGQTAVASDLVLTDNTFVGGGRSKVMTTLPILLRPALPRFAAWGDAVVGRVIVNNRQEMPVKGKITVKISGDGFLKDEKGSVEIPFSLKGGSEKGYPFEFEARYATGRVTLSAEATDEGGKPLDGLEVGIPVIDRYDPEVVATSGMTEGSEREEIDLPPDLPSDKGGLDVSFKASLGLAIADPVRRLIYFPYGCSEQKSASLLALLMARNMSSRFGEKYFTSLAPVKKEEIAADMGFKEKLGLLDSKIDRIILELARDYRHWSGGIKYWPESRDADLFPSVQVMWAFKMATDLGYAVPPPTLASLQKYLQNTLGGKDQRFKLSSEAKAYGLWGVSLVGGWDPVVAEELVAGSWDLQVPGLSYLLMALTNHSLTTGVPAEDLRQVSGRLVTLAKQEPRHTSWPKSKFFWSSAVKTTALATSALLQENPRNPLIPRGVAFLLNRKKGKGCLCTQDDLYLSWLAYEYGKTRKEEETDYRAHLTLGDKTLVEKSFDLANLLEIHQAQIPMRGLSLEPMPAGLVAAKEGKGTLYYDLLLKYYLPPEKAPTREEGMIVSRDYYALDDREEREPLVSFRAGENYKGHIVLVVPQEMNYVIVEERLPAGFEPIDMTLATTSRAAALMAGEEEGEEAATAGFAYDDIVPPLPDYGMDYSFSHQEVRDDSILWSDRVLVPGVYHIRYPIRATTAGKFLLPGARAFEFYEPEVFGRSRVRVIKID